MKMTFSQKLLAFYDATIHLLSKYSKSPYALPILIIVSFTESSFFIIPPDFFLIAMCLGNPRKTLLYVFVTTIASVLGGLFGYAIGYFAYEGFLASLIANSKYQDSFIKFQEFYDEYGLLAILIAGFTPIPYKIATIASGVFQSNLMVFIFASAFSRGLRFFLVGYVIKYGAASGRVAIEKHLKKLIYIISATLVIISLLYVYYKG